MFQLLHHLTPGRRGYHGHPLFPLDFILQVVSFTDQFEVVFLVVLHFGHSRILLTPILFALLSLSPEHPRQKLGIIADLLKVLLHLLVELDRLLQLRHVLGLVLGDLLVCLFLQLFHITLLLVQFVYLFLHIVDVKLFDFKLVLELVHHFLRVHFFILL